MLSFLNIVSEINHNGILREVLTKQGNKFLAKFFHKTSRWCRGDFILNVSGNTNQGTICRFSQKRPDSNQELLFPIICCIDLSDLKPVKNQLRCLSSFYG